MKNTLYHLTAPQQPKCPNCRWGSRVAWSWREKIFKCSHCRTEFNPDGTVIKTPNKEG